MRWKVDEKWNRDDGVLSNEVRASLGRVPQAELSILMITNLDLIQLGLQNNYSQLFLGSSDGSV